MLHGLLLDQRGEFFIEKVEELPLAQNKVGYFNLYMYVFTALCSIYECMSAENFAQDGDEEEEGIQVSPEPQLVNLATQDTSLFRINHSLTPSYLPLRVVEKVLSATVI